MPVWHTEIAVVVGGALVQAKSPLPASRPPLSMTPCGKVCPARQRWHSTQRLASLGPGIGINDNGALWTGKQFLPQTCQPLLASLAWWFCRGPFPAPHHAQGAITGTGSSETAPSSLSTTKRGWRFAPPASSSSAILVSWNSSMLAARARRCFASPQEKTDDCSSSNQPNRIHAEAEKQESADQRDSYRHPVHQRGFAQLPGHRAHQRQ